MKNTLVDLNNILFAQLEKLGDEDVVGEELKQEQERAKSIAQLAQTLINNNELALKAIKHSEEYGSKVPRILQLGDEDVKAKVNNR